MKITQQGPTVDSVVSVITAVSGTALAVQTAGSFAVVSGFTVDTNAAGLFAASSVASNHVTITAHGYKTGLKGQLTTVGSLPTGLATSTDYFIIVVDTNTVKFATSYANSIVPTPITISGGSGNSTFTPTSLAGATVVGQWSVDGTTYINDGSPTSITTTGTFGVKVDRPQYNYYRLTYAITAGSLTIANTSVINKDSA